MTKTKTLEALKLKTKIVEILKVTTCRALKNEAAATTATPQ